MFSIAAINDTDSKGQWEPLAPTKEAQEFHLSQTYNEGLLKLQSKEYDKARELLESVLKDPLISAAQEDGKASDSHLLQLRFLTLKNLATVFLQQGSAHYESALRCYLQAVEIDTKDSVVWNQLGTLACSMGSLSISRWAFEQGLLCSPNNWNCMEKLLEVLIAIGDEVACLSVAELILRHWPSHSRALIVKNIIEESESVPFAPRGIDKLEPKHVRLKFIDKRKVADDNLDESVPRKKLKKNLEVSLPEASWATLAEVLLDILIPLSVSGSELETRKEFRSGDVRLAIRLPSSSDIVIGVAEQNGANFIEAGEPKLLGEHNSVKKSITREKEANVLEEQPLERRSTRLRSRKPENEERELAAHKDLAKDVLKFLESFIVGKQAAENGELGASCRDQVNSLEAECQDVAKFLRETSGNYGAYHMAHLLLEYAARRRLTCYDAFVKFLDLEKLTRNCGLDRSAECSLFLAELYYDLGSAPHNFTRQSEYMLEVSYLLCIIIESVALSYPFQLSCASWDASSSSKDHSQSVQGVSTDQSICNGAFLDNSLLTDKSSFWARFFWLSGRLSILEGNKSKAREHLSISLSLLGKMNDNDSLCLISLPHCKSMKELTIDRILHEVNLLQIDFLLDKTLDEMIEKEMYLDCVSLLAPLLLSTKDVHLDLSSLSPTDKGEQIRSAELSALDILIKACEKTKPTNPEVYLNCHIRKLQILMVVCGMDGSLVSYKSFNRRSESKMHSDSDIESRENSSKHWNHLITEEVKAISQCVSRLKNICDQSGDSNTFIILESRIHDLQSLLLVVMCNVASNFLCKISSGTEVSEEIDQKQQCCFVDAITAFCKLQHLVPTLPIQTQVELIVAAHDLLAEYGLCCAGDGDEGEGTFLKFAIKHLLALNLKLKSSFSSPIEETIVHDQKFSDKNPLEASQGEFTTDSLDVEMGGAETSEHISVKMDSSSGIMSTKPPTHSGLEKENTLSECEKHCIDKANEREKVGDDENEISEDEREELELMIENALDQCFFCLYSLNLRSDSSYEDDLVLHRNSSRGDYQTKEQCADVFEYVLPYAKSSSKTGLVKLRKVLRAIRKHFSQPPEDILAENAIDSFLDDPDLCEDKLSEEAGSEGFLETIKKKIFPGMESHSQCKTPSLGSSEPYLKVYQDLYYFLAQSEEMSTTDKWPGFVLTKEGEEFVQQNANLFKYDLLYNPFRFESWQRLANIYDEEVDLLLNDGSKQLNVTGWRKNATLSQRVETSRRRSRRCLLMSLALARTSTQQSEIHELLALVYYDSLQNVVPFYDQRSFVPSKDATWKMYCENSLRHFKKAFAHKEDWSYPFYLGKLSEKLGYSHEKSFSYYEKAIALNPSAVDPLYRMHASRLKLLCTKGKQNLELLKVLSAYSFSQSAKDAVINIFNKMDPESLYKPDDNRDGSTPLTAEEMKHNEMVLMEEVWDMLYNDCLSALETCIEGDLKHFHKARYMLAQGLYRRGRSGDLEKAKEELSFCFKSSRSSFTIYMWEIDGMVKKGRRKTAGFAGSKRILEVNLPESSRKFITCIRKYLLLYLKLLEETGDISTLDRAYVSLKSDKRFSLCVEDLVPVALGRYIRTLLSSMQQGDPAESDAAGTSEHQLEKIFDLFMEQGNLWPEICCAPEIMSGVVSESSLYGYLHQYIATLEINGKLEVLEGINEKIRKRFKNPKLSNSNCAKVCRHASVAWCRSLIISLASITLLPSSELQAPSPADASLEYSQLLCLELQTDELWNSPFEEKTHLKNLETKWNPILTKMKNTIVKRALDVNMETATSLLKYCYNFYKESSYGSLPAALSIYLVPSRSAAQAQLKPGMDGVEILDVSIPRKLLLWAYTLVQGRFANISTVVKHCEENVKVKVKKGSGTPPVLTHTSICTYAGGAKDGIGQSGNSEASGGGRDGSGHGGHKETEIPPAMAVVSTSSSMCDTTEYVLALPYSGKTSSGVRQPQQN